MSNNKGSPYTYESVLHGWPILAASALVVGFLVIKKRSDADHRNNRILQENTQLKAEIEQLNQKLENSREQINQHSSLIEVQAQKILNLQKIESELQALKKRESEWQNLQSQLNSEVKRLKEENSRNLSKCTTLAEECDKLKLVLASAESSNQQKESKLKELQQNFELQRSQQLKTSQQESEQLNRTISTLEEKVKEYQLQIEEQRKKLQVCGNLTANFPRTKSLMPAPKVKTSNPHAVMRNHLHTPKRRSQPLMKIKCLLPTP